MHDIFINTVLSLKDNPAIDQVVVQGFLNRIKADTRLTRDEGVADHLCSFLIPVNKASRRIYIGNHIKAAMWIPPGGHIDKGELPLQAVRREFAEELSHTLTDEKIELFDISIIEIENKSLPCTFHYDFWFLVHTPVIDFNVDLKEFREAGWYPAETAAKMVTRPAYQPRMERLATSL